MKRNKRSRETQIESRIEQTQMVKQKWAIQKAYKNYDFSKVTAYVKNFILEYPEDEFGKYYYAKLLRVSGLYEDSLEILESLDRKERFMVALDRIKCHLELKHYYQVIDLTEKYLPLAREPLAQAFLRRAKVYAHKQLGIMPKISRGFSYVEKQIYDYDKNRAEDYIKSAVELNEDIDILELLENIEEQLPNSKFLTNSIMLTDSYFFSYPNVGTVEGEVANFLKVTTIHHSSNIIEISPIKTLKRREASFLNLNQQIIPVDPQKRTSQVERFYKRYQKTLEYPRKI